MFDECHCNKSDIPIKFDLNLRVQQSVIDYMLFSNNLDKQLLVEEIKWSGIRSEHNELLTCLTLNIDNHKRKKIVLKMSYGMSFQN